MFIKCLKYLKYTDRSRREVDLHWRASHTCNYIVQIKDVYETSGIIKQLLLVMEW